MEIREQAKALPKNITDCLYNIFSQRKTDFEPVHIEKPVQIRRFGKKNRFDSKTEIDNKSEKEADIEQIFRKHMNISKSEMEVTITSTQIESIDQSSEKIVDQDLSCFENQCLCEVCSKPQDLITLSCNHSLCKSHLIDSTINFIKSHQHNYLSNQLNLRIKCSVNTCKQEFNPKILHYSSEIQSHLETEILNYRRLMQSSRSCQLCKDPFSSSHILESQICQHFCFDCITILRHFHKYTCSFCFKDLIDLKEFNKSCENCGTIDGFTQLKLCKNNSLCFRCSFQSVISKSCLLCDDSIQETIIKKLVTIKNFIKKGIFN